MNAPWYRQDRPIVICCFLVFIALAGARCWNNLPWCDEGWFFDTVHNLLTHGRTGVTVLVAKGFPWDGIERYQFWQPPMYWIVDSAWASVFGLSLAAFRSLSVVAGVVLLCCWYWLLGRFGAPRLVRLLALGLMATDYAVVKAASDGRMDMLAAAFGLSGITLYVKLRETRFGWAVLLSQTLIACGGLTHPMGGLPYLGMFVYFFVRGRDWQRVRWQHLPLAACPYAVGAAGWGAYILQDWPAFHKIFLTSNVGVRMKGIFNPLLALKSEILSRYLEPFGLRSSFWVVKTKLAVPLVYLAGMAAVWLVRPLRREAFLRPFLALWSIAALSLLFLDRQRNGTYMVHVFPLYAILLASLFWWLWERAAAWQRAAMAAALAGFVLLQGGGSAYLIVKSPMRLQYQPVVEFVKAHARPGDRVVGSAELGFGLGFDSVYDDMPLGYFSGVRPDLIVLTPRYHAWYEMERTREPEAYRFAMRRLEEFQLAYRNDAFEVYLPRR